MRHEVDDHRGVVGGALPGPLVAVDEGAGDPAGQRGRGQDEVDPQAAVPLEALPVVVPVGVDVRPGRVRVGRRRPSRRRGTPGRPPAPAASRGSTSRTAPGRRRPRRSGRCSSRRPAPSVASSQPRAGLRAAGPASRACRRSAGRRACGRWGRRATRCAPRRTSAPIARDSAATGSPYPGMPAKPTSTSSRPTRLTRRHAVPLVDAGDGDVVAEGLQAHQRQLVLAGLGLLQREHVDVVALQERLDAVDAGAEGVDVPGGDAHPPTLRRGSRCRSWSGKALHGNPLQIAPRWGGSSAAHWSRELRATLLHLRMAWPIPPIRRTGSDDLQRSRTRGDRPRRAALLGTALLAGHSPPPTRRRRSYQEFQSSTFVDADNAVHRQR